MEYVCVCVSLNELRFLECGQFMSVNVVVVQLGRELLYLSGVPYTLPHTMVL